MSDRTRWLVEPGSRVHLSKIDPQGTDGAPGDKEETQGTYADLWERLQSLQARLYAESARSLLVVLQAMDAGGKDGTIKNVFRGVDPLGVHVAAFKAPTEDELARDFLWRVHSQVPRDGDITVFNRSHYEDVLIVKVRDWIDDEECERRFEHIRAFESLLTSTGTTIVKVFLHISNAEQQERLQARVDHPEKRWKFNPADLDERARWDDYIDQYERTLEATATPDAPWYVVPADRKWYRNWAVLRILVETLEHMDPQFPDAVEGVEGTVVT